MGKIRHQLVEDQVIEIHEVVFYRFAVADTEDPDIHAGEPLWKWQESPQGQFVKSHAVSGMTWHRSIDTLGLGYRYLVTAELESKKLSEYYLRFGKDGNNPIW